jgi:uncharacterized membrane protein YdjX (TVP38/TMEM64 family)
MGEAIALMARLIRFILNMDARAWRTTLVMFVLAGGAGFIFMLAIGVLGFEGKALVQQWLGFAAQSQFALLIAIVAFAVLAFLGVPQVALIAAAVVAFGPTLGFAYSWIGTMVSSLVGFYLGRAAGAAALERFSGAGVKRFMDMVGRNGFFASFIVRLVPSAPFIVVNMAAGVTPMRVVDFTLGTALGIVPKIVLTAFAGNSIVRLMKGEIGKDALWLAAIAVAWLAIGLVARAWLKSREKESV